MIRREPAKIAARNLVIVLGETVMVTHDVGLEIQYTFCSSAMKYSI